MVLFIIIPSAFSTPLFSSINLLDLMPGKSFKDLIQKPESSAKQGKFVFLNPYNDLILAFSSKVWPFSIGIFKSGKL